MKATLTKGLILCGLMLINLTTTAAVDSELKVKLNTNVLSNFIHIRDQQVFKIFENVELRENLNLTKKITFSLEPQGVALDDFDFDLHFSDDYLGAETNKVQITGQVMLKDKTKLTFSAPVPLIKGKYIWNKTEEQFALEESESVFKIGKMTGKGLTSELSQEITTSIHDYMEYYKYVLRVGGVFGNELLVGTGFPIDALVPTAVIYHGAKWAEKHDLNSNFFSLDYSLKKFEPLDDDQQKKLKEIKHDFTNEKNKDGDKAIAQLIVDDNLINSITSKLTSFDYTYSAHEYFLKLKTKRTKYIWENRSKMKMGLLNKLFPSLGDKYGDDALFDVIVTASHNYFKQGFPKAKISGFYMDKNGNMRIQLNARITINAQKENIHERDFRAFEEARQVYISLVVKFKLTVNDANDSTKKLAFAPKSLEVTNLKVLNNGQEEENEQLMIQSLINIQLENLQNEYLKKEYSYYIQDLIELNPKELQCFGFNITDFNVAFKKGFIQASVYHKETQTPNKTYCEELITEIREDTDKWKDDFLNSEQFNEIRQKVIDAQDFSPSDESKNKKSKGKGKKKQEDQIEHEEF